MTRINPPQSLGVPVEYLPLHKYLDERYADTVVLRFSEIEDILGCSLPDLASVEQQWWATADVTPSAQSQTWTQASRTATPNLSARTVRFERTAT